MKSEQYSPNEKLKPFIKNFMFIESDNELSNFILPNTSLVMSLRYKGNVSVKEKQNENNLSNITISGLRRSSRLINYSKKTANLLIVFKEGGINQISKIPSNEFFDLNVPLDNFFRASQIENILEKLSEANNNRERVGIIENVILKNISTDKTDLLVNNSIQLIKRHNGIIKIKELSNNFDLSQDAFEKKFRKVVGTTPKHYASIIRMRNLIKDYQSYNSLTEACYDFGYFDQSHFIKEFKIFTGINPKEFFKLSEYW